MSDKKYELILHDCKTFTDSNGVQFNLYRIRALKDFHSLNGLKVHAGDFGGRVGGECNLHRMGIVGLHANVLFTTTLKLVETHW